MKNQYIKHVGQEMKKKGEKEVIIISGNTDSGRTTFLASLQSNLNPQKRIVVETPILFSYYRVPK